MRSIDSNSLAALAGSRAADSLSVWAWYNGQLAVRKALTVSQWSLGWDATAKWGNLDLTVVDPTHALAPWLLEDPLGVGGARLQVIYNIGNAGSVNMGWYRIKTSKPFEAWSGYIINDKGVVTPSKPIAPDQRLAAVPRGSLIPVTGYDYAAMVDDDQFIAPESPVGASPTVVGEIKRLLNRRVPVIVTSGVVDAAIEKTYVYNQSYGRWQAVQDLAALITCDVRMNGNGQCEIYPLTAQPATQQLMGGPGGLLVEVNRVQDSTQQPLYNYFVADGTQTIPAPTTSNPNATQQVPVRGTAQITSGPLAVDWKRNGRVTKFFNSKAITSQWAADAYAQQMMATQLAGLTTDLAITCAPMPHLQVGDWVQVFTPRTSTGATPLTGRIVAVTLRGNRTTVDPMALTVRCNYNDVKLAFADGGGQASLAGPITRH